ncbi:MAG: thioredoxin domain-containing protein, partial [Gammaproteobacteria bacterium]
MKQRNSYSNHLAHETSPYLLQHAHNPVDWYPWGPVALEKARTQNKPILLSVGYSACHWCHVMAHESFEDEATAELMNRLFVNIKVDREERPDIDKIYQTAHSLLTRRPGGWPLTVFLTPDDQVPFFAGTYFPDEPRHGMPSFRELMQHIDQFLAENGQEIRTRNSSLINALQSISARAPT